MLRPGTESACGIDRRFCPKFAGSIQGIAKLVSSPLGDHLLSAPKMCLMRVLRPASVRRSRPTSTENPIRHSLENIVSWSILGSTLGLQGKAVEVPIKDMDFYGRSGHF